MKIQRKPLSLAIKIALGMATVSLPLSGFANETESNEVIEEVVATGSHIKGLDLEGATNAVQLNSKDIMESGADSLVDLLDSLSVTGGGGGTFSTEGAGPGSGQNPVGSSAVSLRGLGTSSTLTLVNGRRVSVSSFAAGGTESFVDINTIPMSAVERIEILASGASATYGADAVAGVINVILKKDYNGLEISGSYGNSTASSDDSKTNLNLVWGKSTGNARGLVVLDYFKREPLFERDRDITAVSNDPSADGIYSTFRNGSATGDDRLERADCLSDTSGNFFYDPDGEFGETCEYNVNADSLSKGEFESTGVTATFDYDFGMNTWFNELMYQGTKSQGNRSGSAFGSNGLRISANHPGFASPDVQDFINNPLVIDGEEIQSAIGADDFYTVWGRMPEARATEVETSAIRFVSGISGQLDLWDYETAITVGRSESEQTAISGFYNREALQAGLLGKLCTDGTIVNGDFSYNGDKAVVDNVQYTPGGATCESLGKSTVWYDPFNGKQNQSAEMEALLEVDGSRKGASNLYAWDAKASTLDLFALPAGPVAGAFGLEWRREEVEDVPSTDLLARPDNTDPVLAVSSTGAEYSRDQYAAYGELSIPLMEGFEAQVAGRYDNFDDFGDSFNGKLGLRYQLMDEVIFRANYSQSYRAPSLAQSGLTTLLTSYDLQGLCDETTNQFNDDANNLGLCDTTQREVNSLVVGNDSLEPETADTYGFGVLLRPTYDIEINIDWWKIDYEDVIVDADDAWLIQTLNGQTDGQVVTNQNELTTTSPGVVLSCDPNNLTSSSLDGCNGVPSELVAFQSQQINAGSQSVQGIDFVYTHYLMDNAHGQLTLLGDASYLIEFEEQIVQGGEIENLEGEFRYPQLVGNLKLRYRFDNWSTSLSANYTSEYNDDVDTDAGSDAGFAATDIRKVPSWTTYNFSASYDFANKSYVQLNVNNILDEEPNFVYGSGANVDYSNSDIMGRFINVRYTHVF